MFYCVFTSLKYFTTLYHTRHEADRSTKSISEVNKAWRYNSSSQYAYMLSWRLINYKDMLIFLPLQLRHYSHEHQMKTYEQDNLWDMRE